MLKTQKHLLSAIEPNASRVPKRWLRSVQRIHFVGIGGAGMGGIAEVLVNLGFHVSGSDRSSNAMVRRLESQGVEVHIGHDSKWIEGCGLLVRSSAIADDNPELIEARRARIPIVPRAQMLAELMRLRAGIAIAGTHGKTTTTSLVACLLAEGGFDPTYVVGGLVTASGVNARLGEGRYLVAEADESDASFLLLQPVLAVVTNIDADHLETYDGDFNRLLQAFVDFLHHLPFYGHAVVCLDDANIVGLLPQISKQIVTYGIESDADFRATDIRADGPRTHFTINARDGEPLAVTLNLPGTHNVLNALAAVAVAHLAGVEDEAVQRGLASFQGIGRRLQLLGQRVSPQGNITLVDDYAHHPTELKATLQAVRASWPEHRLVVVFQPHRYTRTRDLLDDFVVQLSDPDVLVVLEVYAAGEAPIPGADGRSLCRALRARGQSEPVFCEDLASIPEVLENLLVAGDVLLISGAGDVGTLPAVLCQRWPEEVSP